MTNFNEKKSQLNVPYFKQSYSATCGPASLIMVMKYWNNSIKLSKELEFLIWMKSNPFVFFGGTLQFGLAKIALKMGFKTKIYQKARFSEYHPNLPTFFNLYEDIVSFNARRAKIPIYYGHNVLDIISENIAKKIPPIVFLNLKPILGENVLHWLVVTDINEEKVYVNEPYIPLGSSKNLKKDYPIELNIFKKSIATDQIGNLHLPPCVLIVYK